MELHSPEATAQGRVLRCWVCGIEGNQPDGDLRWEPADHTGYPWSRSSPHSGSAAISRIRYDQRDEIDRQLELSFAAAQNRETVCARVECDWCLHLVA